MSRAVPPADRLVAAGLRVTAPRVAALDAITPGEHLDADTVAQRVRHRLGSVSTQAVYDVLRALTSAGMLRRIEPAGSPARYENRVADNHHHLVCRSCGAITDGDCLAGAVPCLSPPDSSGFVVTEAEVTFWGLCPRCTSGRSDPTSDSLPPTPKG